MTEGQPPREAAVAGLDALPNVPVEERDALQQSSGDTLDDFLNLLGAYRVGHREGEIEFRGGCRRQRFVSLDDRRRSLEWTTCRITCRRDLPRVNDPERYLDAVRRRGPNGRVQSNVTHHPYGLA